MEKVKKLLNILYVDDNYDDFVAIRRFLSKDPDTKYNVTHLMTSKDLFTILSNKRFDCLLIDHELPDAKGVDTIQAIKKSKDFEYLPIIMLSGHGSEKIIINALKSGVDDYSPKSSITVEWLIVAIQGAIEKAKLKEKTDSEEKEIKEALSVKSKFMANMSHELRTPLNAIIGLGNLIKEEKDVEVIKEHVNMMMKSGHHLLHLIDDILDVSKIEDEKEALYLEETRLLDVVTEVSVTLRPLFEESNNTSKVISNIETDVIITDSQKIKKCLYNVLSNATKFSNNNEILITLTEDDEFIKVDVTDNGIGISEHKLNKILMPFSQANDSIVKEFEDTGLSLSISSSCMKLLGGNLKVSSELGEYTKFTMFIPKVSESIEVSSLKSEQTLLSQTSILNDELNLNILVVEDNLINTKLIVKTLEKLKCNVTTAINGKEGVEACINTIPDLVLMDIMMPVMDGWEASKLIKENRITQHIPIIIITASADSVNKKKAGEYFCSDLLNKPLNLQQLVLSINKAVAMKKLAS